MEPLFDDEWTPDDELMLDTLLEDSPGDMRFTKPLASSPGYAVQNESFCGFCAS